MVRGKLIVRVKMMVIMIKLIVDCDDDANGGGGNSNDDGSVDGDGIFENWCVDGEGADKADNGDEQTKSVAGGLANVMEDPKRK